jgi:PAS domain S-box-containing protein
MKIKTKLSLGIVFLFAEFLLVSLCSLYFIFKISQQNNLITKNNNLSIGYVENMLQIVDKINNIKASAIFSSREDTDEKMISGYLMRFDTNLINEENNITEPGEKELAQTVRDKFEKIRILLTDSVEESIPDKPGYYFTNFLPLVNDVKSGLFSISDVNMTAIIRKNNIANNTATHSYAVLSIIASICFIVFFALIFSFPKYIARPIEILSKSIKEISNNNYDSRVYFNTNDEFGEISEVYNNMVDKLKRYENIEIGKLIDDKQRAESVINTSDEPVVLLDENQYITLINSAAEDFLGIKRSDIINKKITHAAAYNEILALVIKELEQNKVGPAQKFTRVVDGIKNVYINEIHMITSYSNNKELIEHIGYKISIKKISKANTG